MSGEGVAGWMEFADVASDAAHLRFIIEQMLGFVRTAVIVQVQGVNTAALGALTGTVGVVNAKPLVKMTDGLLTAYSHGTIYNLPYLRLQGGKNAIVCDPAIDDIGLAIICDRDVSAVKDTQAEAAPNSYRRFDLADGMYLGGFLNGVPDQYVQFTGTGINITDMHGNSIVMGSGGIVLNDKVTIDSGGNITTSGEVQAGSGNIKLTQHVHSGVTTGSADTGLPVG